MAPRAWGSSLGLGACVKPVHRVYSADAKIALVSIVAPPHAGAHAIKQMCCRDSACLQDCKCARPAEVPATLTGAAPGTMHACHGAEGTEGLQPGHPLPRVPATLTRCLQPQLMGASTSQQKLSASSASSTVTPTCPGPGRVCQHTRLLVSSEPWLPKLQSTPGSLRTQLARTLERPRRREEAARALEPRTCVVLVQLGLRTLQLTG